jgi:hypothetical protein
VSIRSLAEALDVNRNTAWRMHRRFVSAMASPEQRAVLVNLTKELLHEHASK